jgi:hypothetical protein
MIGWIVWAALSLATGGFAAYMAKWEQNSPLTWWLLVPGAVCSVIGGVTFALFFAAFGFPPFGGG